MLRGWQGEVWCHHSAKKLMRCRGWPTHLLCTGPGLRPRVRKAGVRWQGCRAQRRAARRAASCSAGPATLLLRAAGALRTLSQRG